MAKSLYSFIDETDLPLFQKYVGELMGSEREILLRNDIVTGFKEFLKEDPEASAHSCWRFLRKVQEALIWEGRLIVIYRHRRANCRVYVLNGKGEELGNLEINDFLEIKEHLVRPDLSPQDRTMEINLSSFYDYGPILKDPQTIGHGIKHLNRHMSARLTNQPDKWNQVLYEFLKLHQLHGVQLLLDGEKIRDSGELESALEDALDFLDRCDPAVNPERIAIKLKKIGFLDGWGNSRNRIQETLHLLQDTLEQPNEDTQEELLSRIPMVSKVTMISPHGWFGQDNVLGRPDTGGQVVYILDQARALEKYLAADLALSGWNVSPKIIIVTRLIPENDGTTCDQRLEKVHHTDNVWILRVPFVDRDGAVVPHWISRFRVWPYLDQFAEDVESEIKLEFKGRPDLIIGNYSDGNLVATMLSRKMGVIQCNIAHALEKSKYLFSDIYWQDFEEEYHFSVQFMADLIAMNLANFIISSTSQEIIGTERSIGQYESYQFFTMPGLMQVTNGINLFHPRFNVIPPGVNNRIYFPFTEKKRRRSWQKIKALSKMVFEGEDPESFGRLDNPELPPIFSIARLDRIKNLTGLVEAYGKSEKLRKQANLVLVASVIDPEQSGDTEEKSEIGKMYELIDRYQLHGSVRWIGKMLSGEDAGEVYRIMADRRGVFVQPALFEAFGLTILEAMHSGLPVFATQFGGPLEIIENRESGILINPTIHEDMTDKLSAFFDECRENPGLWQLFSQKGITRAQSRFTWDLHCRQLTRLAKVYGFWRYSSSDKAKSRLTEYC
ncbi:MAG: sucrose synthase, partial [Desulfurivibrionaceae bacterium]|nr:sucrose synthase [Desulfurivibrionaceae bacterium]